ncbi:MAG: hypothetical protein PVF15_09300 [Candidatus Bathyarchaeota archaeon]|jgi:hypothetical protein
MREKETSGQVLLIAAFIMALLLLSAELYIFDVGRIMVEVESDSLNDFVLAVRLGSRHVVVGSLANISNGGSSSVLEWNLQNWTSLIDEQYQFGKSVLNYTLREAAPYSSGIWIDWGTTGSGVSSVSVNLAYKLLGREVNLNQSYSLNVTTTLLIESTYRQAQGDDKEINVTINVLNDEKPALAKQITVYYKDQLNNWVIPDTANNNYTIIDLGNSTYLASFIANIPAQDVEISTHVLDQRAIYVQASATSTEI